MMIGLALILIEGIALLIDQADLDMRARDANRNLGFIFGGRSFQDVIGAHVSFSWAVQICKADLWKTFHKVSEYRCRQLLAAPDEPL